jgi:hypothetical protein
MVFHKSVYVLGLLEKMAVAFFIVKFKLTTNRRPPSKELKTKTGKTYFKEKNAATQ